MTQEHFLQIWMHFKDWKYEFALAANLTYYFCFSWGQNLLNICSYGLVILEIIQSDHIEWANIHPRVLHSSGHLTWILLYLKTKRRQSYIEKNKKVFFIRYYENLLSPFYVSTLWKGINCKQSARWQHVSWLKASAFCIW